MGFFLTGINHMQMCQNGENIKKWVKLIELDGPSITVNLKDLACFSAGSFG